MAAGQEKSIGITTTGPKRAVVLVTCPVDQLANTALAFFGTRIERKTPPISTWKPGAYPRVAGNLSFARHMAICLIPMEAWESDELSFRDKLAADRNGCGLSWAGKHVESIEAVELLGTTDEWDFAITNLYGRLHRDWVYLPFWWNCQDFAIRLAYVIQPTANARRLLRRMICDLKLDMMERVIGKRDELLGWYGGFGLLIRARFHQLDSERRTLSETYMRRLEGRFPSLESFHAGVRMEMGEEFGVEVKKREGPLLFCFH
ncbi:hypothetical protein RB595_002246 [Gaeumannomyces hyphopodioides]